MSENPHGRPICKETWGKLRLKQRVFNDEAVKNDLENYCSYFYGRFSCSMFW